MSIVLIVFILEFFLYGLLFAPNGDTNTNVAGWFFLAINTMVTIFAISASIKNVDKKEESNIKKYIIGSLFFRITIMLWDLYGRSIFILPNSEGDAEWYHRIAESYAFGARADVVAWNRYSFYVGQLYKIIGSQKMTAQFLNVFLAIWSIVLIYRILCMFNVNKKTRERAVLFACFLPNLAMITTFMLQESVVAFLIILSLYFYSKWWFSNNYGYILLTVTFSLLASVLHMGGIVVAVGILSLMFVVNGKEHTLKLSPGRIISIILLIFVVILVLSMFGDTFLGKLGGDVSAEKITHESELREGGGGGYVIGISGLPTSLDLIVNTPIRMLYFVFSPVPWMWRGLNDIFAFFFSTLFYIYVVVKIFKVYGAHPIKNLKDDNIVGFMFVLTIILIIGTIMFGWGVSNSGSVLRHREKFTYLFILLYAISEETILRVWEKNARENSVSDSPRLQSREVSA